METEKAAKAHKGCRAIDRYIRLVDTVESGIEKLSSKLNSKFAIGVPYSSVDTSTIQGGANIS
jgi:hypothetical protein